MTSIVLAWLPSQQWKEQGPGSLPANQPRVSLWQCSVIKPWSSAASKVESDLTLTSSHQVLTLSKMMTTCTCLPTILLEIWDLESYLWYGGMAGLSIQIQTNTNQNHQKSKTTTTTTAAHFRLHLHYPDLVYRSVDNSQTLQVSTYVCCPNKSVWPNERERGSKWWILYILRHVWK